jgi:hypothetical protein
LEYGEGDRAHHYARYLFTVFYACWFILTASLQDEHDHQQTKRCLGKNHTEVVLTVGSLTASTFGSTPAFGFGASTSQASPSIFGTTSTSLFGQPLGAQSTPAFSFPSFGAASTPSNQLSLFQPPQQQTQLAPSAFGTGMRL